MFKARVQFGLVGVGLAAALCASCGQLQPGSDAGTAATGGGSAATGGGSATTGGGTASASLRIFTTSTGFTGNLQAIAATATGLEGGHRLCQVVADTRRLGGTWKAWLSSNSVSAVSQFTAAGPWGLNGGDGGIVFANVAALRGQGPMLPLERDEDGNSLSAYSVWTGTTVDGGTSGDTCADWSSTTASGSYGTTSDLSSGWTHSASGACTDRRALYCFEQAKTLPDGGTSYAPLGPAKRLFVTSAGYTGNLQSADGGATGLLGGDAICNAVATGATLGGTWRAFLSSSTTRAIDRLTFGGPWTLVGGDGGIVFGSIGELALFSPRLPIDRDQTGAQLPRYEMWTGTTLGGGTSGSNCSNWSSTAGLGTQGVNVDLNSGWVQTGDVSCTQQRALYCFEQ